MRRIIGPIGMFVLSATAITCGPPPAMLMGQILYTEGCRDTGMGNGCASAVQDFSGEAGTGSPALLVTCLLSAGEPNRFRLTIARSAGNIEEGVGVSFCGSLSGTSGLVQGAIVNLFSRGDQSRFPASRNPPTAACAVTISALDNTANSISGHIRCDDLADQGQPAKLHFIRGVSRSENPTADVLQGDFAFTTCTQGNVGTCM